MKLKSGTWVGGFFSERSGRLESYAAKQSGEQRDFYLGAQAWIDPASGDFKRHPGPAPTAEEIIREFGPPPDHWLAKPAKKADSAEEERPSE